MTESKVQIAFYGTEELRRRLKKIAAERGVFVQDIIDEAVSRVFTNESGFSTETLGTVRGHQTFAKGSEHLHMMIDFIYTSAPSRLSQALGMALDAFAQVTHAYADQRTARTTSSPDDEDTEHLIIEAREVTKRAERTLHDEAGSDPGNTSGTAQKREPLNWRKQA